ncbi:CHAT domain-containing protein [Mycena pura]|uniref:CHAT domain-containing protein n=1 Tax=Mycena pura TaxID=153505 RepID=A0AAD6Y0H7_9AGAR|nr:CHAT domain-containing protein [Mycena pura]
MHRAAEAKDAEALLLYHAVDEATPDSVIEMLRKVMHGLTQHHEQALAVLVTLGSALVDRNRDKADLDEAVRLLQRALDRHPRNPLYQAQRHILNCLSTALLNRFDLCETKTDIDGAISRLQEAIEVVPDGNRNKLVLLDNLCEAFTRRFIYYEVDSDADGAVEMAGNALDLTPDNHPQEPVRVDALGRSLSRRYEVTGNPADARRAIAAAENALRMITAAHPDYVEFHMNLAITYSTFYRRFLRLRHIADLERAIELLRSVQTDTRNARMHRTVLGKLGVCLVSRYSFLDESADVVEAIALLEETVAMTPDVDEDSRDHLNYLTTAYTARFERLGDIGDIDKSISLLENCLQKPQSVLENYQACKDNLGSALILRFRAISGIRDVDRAIEVLDQVVASTEDKNRNKHGRLTNLGIAHLLRFTETQKLADIQAAVASFENVVKATQESCHPRRDFFLNNLALALNRRFDWRSDIHPGDIDRAIALFEEAVQLCPDNRSGKAAYLNNLVVSLLFRFRREHNFSDIEKAIVSGTACARLTPVTHVDYSSHQFNLGEAWLLHFREKRERVALNIGIQCFSYAALASSGPPRTRFRAASEWSHCAWADRHESLLEACKTVLELLPQVAWLGLPFSNRLHELIQIGNIVNAAAAASLERGTAENAVEWLEQGRSIVWGQLLQLRSPTDELHEIRPDLATRFRQLSSALEKSNDDLTLENAGQSHRRLTAEWQALLSEIRETTKLKRFLLPKTLSELIAVGLPEPVIMLNVSVFRCDALILVPWSTSVKHLPLINFSFEDATRLRNSLGSLLQANGRHIFEDTSRKGKRENLPTGLDTDQVFASILAELWLNVVHPIVEAPELEPKSINQLPRLWWCPTGALTFLPLHAAGVHDNPTPGNKLSDFAISSYIPTLRALRNYPSSLSEDQQKFRLLGVAVPSGSSPLPGTREELGRISDRVGLSRFVPLIGGHATIEAVSCGIEECRWAHFACHGLQDPLDPSQSSLLLTNETHLTISQLTQLSLPHAELAFLSACQTATGDATLTDEAMHLSAGMLHAGYHSVVGTMWSIMDRDAPQVSDDFYRYLLRKNTPDYRESARALHEAVDNLRLKKDRRSFLAWVPFIHIGA